MMADRAAGERRSGRRRALAIAAIVYLGLLAASQITVAVRATLPREAETGPGERVIAMVEERTASGEATGREIEVSAVRFAPEERCEGCAPIVLLHGSPGDARNFDGFAPELAGAGYEVYSVDLPGYGRSSRALRDYSARASARATLAMLDEIGVERAHVLGWSLGATAGLHIAELAPERAASLTLMAGMASLEGEGSGSHYFERFKYSLGFVFLVGLPELVPHFGGFDETIFGDRVDRFAFLRSFWDTDLRGNAAIMRAVRTPTLILHGRDDFLISAWAAEHHHELMPTSRLVMLDAGHFLPFPEPYGQAGDTADHLLAFVSRHDAEGVRALTGAAVFAPAHAGGEVELGRFSIKRTTAWWVIILMIILATFVTEDGTVIAVGLAIAHGQIDVAVGLTGCFLGIALGDGGLWAIGRFGGRRALRWPFFRSIVSEKSLDRWGRWFDRHSVKAVFLARALPGTRLPTYLAAGLLSKRAHHFLFWAALAALVWTPLLLLVVAVVGPGVLETMMRFFSGPVAVILSILALLVIVRTMTYAFTWTGRRRLLRDVRLPFNREFWPSWVFYLPLAPWIAWLALRHGPMSFTCANPGIGMGGGVVGESKMEILRRLDPGWRWTLPCALVEEREDAAERAALADALVRERGELGGYPIIVKPDAAQRGHALKLARRRADFEEYFGSMTRPAVLQRYHPGPLEVGLHWAREPGAEKGFVFSVTRKEFPEVVGDGKRTLEALVWSHRRYMMQADLFLKRFDGQRDRVLAKGERLRLAVAGNHCQGTKFTDGGDLITPALEREMNALAMGYEDEGFDFGRFDLRYESDEALRAGEGFAVVELNGSMSESTNLYDPAKPVWWAYGVLFRQWSLLYRIGAARRREGVRSMSLGELWASIREHFHGRGGSGVSD